MTTESASLPQPGPTIRRGLRRKCPHCGRGDVLDRGRLKNACDECGYVFERRGGDLFFFLYVGAGAITFVFIVVMYLSGIWAAGWEVRGPYLLLGVGLMIGLMSRRMGLAVALDYLSRVLFEDRSAWDPEFCEESRAGSSPGEPSSRS